MEFRLELFVTDLSESIVFYEGISEIDCVARSETSARFDYDSFSLLLTSEVVLPSDHYFLKRGYTVKGSGVELIIVSDDIYDTYSKIQMKYPDSIESPIKRQEWGMTDFRVTDPDGYYVRITSRKACVDDIHSTK